MNLKQNKKLICRWKRRNDAKHALARVVNQIENKNKYKNNNLLSEPRTKSLFVSCLLISGSSNTYTPVACLSFLSDWASTRYMSSAALSCNFIRGFSFQVLLLRQPPVIFPFHCALRLARHIVSAGTWMSNGFRNKWFCQNTISHKRKSWKEMMSCVALVSSRERAHALVCMCMCVCMRLRVTKHHLIGVHQLYPFCVSLTKVYLLCPFKLVPVVCAGVCGHYLLQRGSHTVYAQHKTTLAVWLECLRQDVIPAFIEHHLRRN